MYTHKLVKEIVWSQGEREGFTIPHQFDYRYGTAEELEPLAAELNKVTHDAYWRVEKIMVGKSAEDLMRSAKESRGKLIAEEWYKMMKERNDKYKEYELAHHEEMLRLANEGYDVVL